MTIQLTNSEQVKDLFKQALLEILQEERELFYDLFAEIIEDMALVKAIKAGEESEVVSRDEVFALLADCRRSQNKKNWTLINADKR
jgi:hypothetical protein